MIPKANDEWIWMAWFSTRFNFVSIVLFHIFLLHILLHIFVAFSICCWILDPLSPSSPSIGRRRTWTFRWASLTLCHWQHNDIPLGTCCLHGVMFPAAKSHKSPRTFDKGTRFFVEVFAASTQLIKQLAKDSGHFNRLMILWYPKSMRL